MTSIAIIGAGPTGVYLLRSLITAPDPLDITLYDAEAEPGAGMPFSTGFTHPAMMANIASIEIPPVCETLVDWLRSQPATALTALGVDAAQIHDRRFYPRLVIGRYYAGQLARLLEAGRARGHVISLKPLTRVVDILPRSRSIHIRSVASAWRVEECEYDHVILATGHRWPAPEFNDRHYIPSPWPARRLNRIPASRIGILGTSLTAIDVAVAIACRHGKFDQSPHATLQYTAALDADSLHITLMSRKGLLPEADFYCPIPYDPLAVCSADAIDRCIREGSPGLLEAAFALFKQELEHADPAFAERIRLPETTVETFSDAYFSERLHTDPFVWARDNLEQAKSNHRDRITVPWRYAILRMHETLERIVPYLEKHDLKRFNAHLKPIFVDEYAAVPHVSIERLLALHAAGRLQVRRLGSEYTLNKSGSPIQLMLANDTLAFDVVVDATGQKPLDAADLPFPGLVSILAPPPRSEGSPLDPTSMQSDFTLSLGVECRGKIYCIAIPHLLKRRPFIQGLVSANEIADTVSKSLLATLRETTLSSPPLPGQAAIPELAD